MRDLLDLDARALSAVLDASPRCGLSTAYANPPPAVVEALGRTAATVVVPAPETHGFAGATGAKAFLPLAHARFAWDLATKLKGSGDVRAWAAPRETYHAKGCWAFSAGDERRVGATVVGSSNWNVRSHRRDVELGAALVVRDGALRRPPRRPRRAPTTAPPGLVGWRLRLLHLLRGWRAGLALLGEVVLGVFEEVGQLARGGLARRERRRLDVGVAEQRDADGARARTTRRLSTTSADEGKHGACGVTWGTSGMSGATRLVGELPLAETQPRDARSSRSASSAVSRTATTTGRRTARGDRVPARGVGGGPWPQRGARRPVASARGQGRHIPCSSSSRRCARAGGA